ncbi:hypothetical protein V2J09_012451 [Rumex salicifolius]
MAATVIQPISLYLLLLIVTFINSAFSDDIKCLQSIKEAVDDPQGSLDSWDFTNTSAGSICKFNGVVCWNDHENRLYKLQLGGFQLSGHIPDSLHLCSSNLEYIDYSGNSFSGSINSSICRWLPYLVSLDFSKNQLTGEIPANLSDCQYLNKLDLSNNQLSGRIPFELATLTRLSTFSVANNRLNGPIPTGLSHFDESSFDGNGGLCGSPAGKCGALSKKNMAIIIAAGVFGAAASLLLGLGLWFWYFSRSSNRRKKGYGLGRADDGSWADRLRAHRLVQVTLFQKPLVKVKLADLMAATHNFSHENVMFSTQLGTTYKAVLPDGSALAVKRLNPCTMNEKQFRTEMNRLGDLRHPNLVPLLGFCVVEDEKLLVYKHMSNGTLNSLLFGGSAMALDWPIRLRICLGIARGIAWLHHGNNPPYLHRNISSNVVLLDEDLDARVIDFGLATLVDVSEGNQSKEDVYAFGVVLLEVITRKKAFDAIVDHENELNGGLVEFVKQLSESGQISEAVDRDLLGKGDDDEILRVLQIACNCVASQAMDRFSMYQAYEALNSLNEDLAIEEQFDDFPLISAELGKFC